MTGVPLPNTRMIHPGFRQHHAGVVAGGMTATVRLSRPPTLGVRDADTGQTPQLPAVPYYTGCARVQSRGPATASGGAADRTVAVGDYLVAVPVDLGGEAPALDDLVDVLACPDDPALAGARLYVVSLPMASIIIQRSLGCDLHQSTSVRG